MDAKELRQLTEKAQQEQKRQESLKQKQLLQEQKEEERKHQAWLRELVPGLLELLEKQLKDAATAGQSKLTFPHYKWDDHKPIVKSGKAMVYDGETLQGYLGEKILHDAVVDWCKKRGVECKPNQWHEVYEEDTTGEGPGQWVLESRRGKDHRNQYNFLLSW